MHWTLIDDTAVLKASGKVPHTEAHTEAEAGIPGLPELLRRKRRRQWGT